MPVNKIERMFDKCTYVIGGSESMMGINHRVQRPGVVRGSADLGESDEVIMPRFVAHYGSEPTGPGSKKVQPCFVAQGVVTVGLRRPIEEHEERSAIGIIERIEQRHVHGDTLGRSAQRIVSTLQLECTRAQFDKPATLALRLTGPADPAAMENDPQAKRPAISGRDKVIEDQFELDWIGFFAQSQPLAEPDHMGVHREARETERHASNHVCCLAADTGERDQVGHVSGNR